MDSPVQTSYKSSPLKFMSRSGKASNNYFNTLYSTYKPLVHSAHKDKFEEFLCDFRDVYISHKGVLDSTEDEKPKLTAVFKTVSRDSSKESIYKKNHNPDPGWYNPNFQYVSKRNDRAPKYQSPEKRTIKDKIVIPVTIQKDYLITEIHQKGSLSDRPDSAEENGFRDTPEHKHSPRKKEKQKQGNIPEKPTPKLVYSLDFKRQTPRKDLISEGPHPQRFNYYPNNSLTLSKNKRTASLNFRKMLNRSSNLEPQANLGNYNPNFNYNRPKIAKSIIGFEKQIPRCRHTRYLSEVSGIIDMKYLEKAFYELSKMKSLPSFPKPERIVSKQEVESKYDSNHLISKTLQEASAYYKSELAKRKHRD